MRVGEGKVVAISYTLRVNGVIRHIRSAVWGDKPLEYLHGAGQIIPGLERALEGKEVGDRFSITLPPEEAYGQRDKALQQKVPAAVFGGVDQVEAGMRLQAQSVDGKHVEMVMITDVDQEEQTVTVDANHPLAGMTLEFDVTVHGIRGARKEEREQGRINAPHSGGAEERMRQLRDALEHRTPA